MDYAGWLARAIEVAERIKRIAGDERCRIDVARPATAVEIEAVERALERKLPPELAAFYRDAAGAVEIEFDLNRYLGGGARIAALYSLPELREKAQRWARDTWVAGDEAEERWWRESLPFTSLATGDMLAVAPHGEVVALVHDDRSVVVAPSFGRFLAVWERLAYVEPSWSALEEVLDPKTGLLDPDCSAAQRLRQRLDRLTNERRSISSTLASDALDREVTLYALAVSYPTSFIVTPDPPGRVTLARGHDSVLLEFYNVVVKGTIEEHAEQAFARERTLGHEPGPIVFETLGGVRGFVVDVVHDLDGTPLRMWRWNGLHDERLYAIQVNAPPGQSSLAWEIARSTRFVPCTLPTPPRFTIRR